jgi:predicted NBD/HSP70 family sugar kinase
VPDTVQVLEALRRKPTVSRADLQAETGMSAASISRAVSELRRVGLVEEVTAEGSGVGRPPKVVRFRPEAAHVVGIDAGGASLRVEIVDLAGTFVTRASTSLRDAETGDSIVERIAEAVEALVDAEGAQPIAAAAGVSGIVDAERGTVLLSPDLPGLNGRNVAAMLEARLAMPVAIDNDDLLAAVGEASFGAATGCSEVVFLSLGLGLGAGLLVGGRPVRGVRSAAGAIAYAVPGPVADVASGRAIPRRYNERARLRSGSRCRTAKRVIELAGAGDPDATAVIDEAVVSLGDLVVSVGALLDPEVIVLGGGLARGIPHLVPALTARLEASLPFPPRAVLSALGEDAVARGAGSLALTLGQRLVAGVHVEPGRLGALAFA